MIVDIVKIRSDADYVRLWDVIPEDFLSHDLMDLMRDSVRSSIRSLVIEYPYVDKDYRITYYGFYSKRHREYGKFCFRLHFLQTIWKNRKKSLKYRTVILVQWFLGLRRSRHWEERCCRQRPLPGSKDLLRKPLSRTT